MGKKKSGKSKAKNSSTKGSITSNNDETTADDNPTSSSNKNNNNKKNNKRNHKNKKHQSSNKNGSYDCQLKQLIEADDTKSVIEMAADGNCLFRSISDQLYHDYGNRHHEQVRNEICDFLEAHEEEFKLFLVLDDQDNRDEEDATDYQQYVENMRQNSEWGGNIELVVAARLYRRNITVYSSALAAFTIDHGSPNKPPAGPDLWLSYHDNDHYNSVRDNTVTKPPPPPIKTYVKEGAFEAREKAKQIAAQEGFHELPPTWDEEDNEEHSNQEGRDKYAVPANNNEEETTSPVSSDGQNEVKDGGGNGRTVTNNDKDHNSNNHKKQSIKKNAPCPCGSGLRYKKCCLARAKHNLRLERMQDGGTDQNETMDADESTTTETKDSTTKEEFRILKI